MKRGIRSVLVAAAAVGTLISGPAVVAHADDVVVAQQDDRDNDNPESGDDDHGMWGLLGLLGLVGLLGLIRRGRRDERLAGPAAQAPATRADVITEAPTEQPPMAGGRQAPTAGYQPAADGRQAPVAGYQPAAEYQQPPVAEGYQGQGRRRP